MLRRLLKRENPPDPLQERWRVDREVAEIFDRHLGDSHSNDAFLAYRNVLPEIVDWALERLR